MNKVLKGLPFAIAYLDYIMIYSKSAKEHLHHDMMLRKCHFFVKEIQYLGHILSNTSIKPLTSKTVAIKPMNPLKQLNR